LGGTAGHAIQYDVRIWDSQQVGLDLNRRAGEVGIRQLQQFLLPSHILSAIVLDHPAGDWMLTVD
jgi:hypothetical protein